MVLEQEQIMEGINKKVKTLSHGPVTLFITPLIYRTWCWSVESDLLLQETFA